VKCKIFDLVLKELNERPARLEKWLDDHRLTSLEKKILVGHSWIRNNLNQKVLDEIPQLPQSEIDFVEAHRLLLIGIAANNLSHFEQAKNFLQDSTQAFASLELHYYHFIGRFNLFLLASNQLDFKSMRQHLEVMRTIPQELALQQLRLLRCEFIFADETNQIELARKWLAEIENVKETLPESDRISQLVSEFMFRVKLEELSEARHVLEQMKKHRKFHLSENFNYMKKLLDHLIDNKPIYAYATDFEQVPVLFHQVQLIQSLEALEKESAAEHWKVLQKMMPQVYGEPFQYLGTKCLFSLALDKHLKRENRPVVQADAHDSKVDQLISILKAHPSGLKKAHLFELLWGEIPESKDDLKRLVRLVYKARQTHQLEIQTRKGSYFVEIPRKKLAV
jgi:hypothetical protein